jgi:hypothetical protein
VPTFDECRCGAPTGNRVNSCSSDYTSVNKLHHYAQHWDMALNIKNQKVERLAAEVAELARESLSRGR